MAVLSALEQIEKTKKAIAKVKLLRQIKRLEDAPPPVISAKESLATGARLGLLRKPVRTFGLPARGAVTATLPQRKPSLDDLLGQRQSISPVSARVTAPFQMPKPKPAPILRTQQTDELARRLGIEPAPPPKPRQTIEELLGREPYQPRVVGGYELPRWQQELSDIAEIALAGIVVYQSVQAGVNALTKLATDKAFTSYANQVGKPVTKADRKAFTEFAMRNVRSGLLKQDLQQLFQRTAKGYVPTPAGAQATQEEARRAIVAWKPTLAPKGTQTGAMAFGGLTPEQMAARTSVQKGLPGLGKEDAQAKMLEEFGTAPGAGGVKPGLFNVASIKAAKAGEPLAGQVAMELPSPSELQATILFNQSQIRELQSLLSAGKRRPAEWRTKADLQSAIASLKAEVGIGETIQYYQINKGGLADVVQAVQGMIADIEGELGNRSMPYHGRATNMFPNMTTRELDAQLKTYQNFVHSVETGGELPAPTIPVTTTQAAQATPALAPAVTAKPQAGKAPPAKPPPPSEPPATTGGTQAGKPQSGDFAGNIRLEKYPEEIRPFLKEWADANPEVIANARRGVRSDAEVLADAQELADDVGGDFTRMQSRWKQGDAWNAEEILALRGTLRAKTEAVLAAQKVAFQVNSTENLLKLKLALEEQAAVQEAVSGVTAEAGRALRQFRQQVFEASTDAEKLERLLKEVGGRDKIEDIAKLLGEIDIDNPTAVNAFIRSLNKPGFWDYITEIYYNSILSGPKTHIVNSLSNTLNAILSPVERGAAALVDMPLSRWQGREQARFLGEVSADSFGAIEGIKDGFRALGETYKTGIRPQQASKFEMQRTKAFTGIPGRVINFPSTSLEAADALMQTVNYRAAFNAIAFRIVKRSGAKGADFVEALAELKINPTKELLAEADKITEARLFRAPAGKTTQTIMNLRDALAIGGFKPLRYIIPFIRTPANLLKYGIERSPAGWLNPKLWVNVAKKNPEAADQIGRAVLGTLAAIAIMWYVVEEKITGAAPTNRAERDRFYRDGKQPFSVKVGNNWISYQRLEPFNQSFAQVAAVYEAMKSREQDAVGKVTGALSTISQNMVSQTYLSGLSSVIDALSQPEQYASRILTRFGTALVIPASSLTRTAAQMIDRTVRDPQNFGEEFKVGIPGLSKQVPSKLTAFGEDVTRKTPAWSPINISPSEETPLTRELDRLQINTGFTGKTIAGIPLTIDEQREFQIQAGQKTRELLTVLIANPAYVALSDADKEKVINATVDKARNLVRVAILTKIAPAERASRLKQGLRKGIPVQAPPATPPVIPRTTIPATPTTPPVPGSVEYFRQRRQELAGATK